jgi:putative tryptophan/tyrosine transport system substrate-binding protein
MRRRDFIAGLCGSVAWPITAQGQQRAMPVIGYLFAGREPRSEESFVGAFRRGLRETGFVEGRNVTIEYRFANNNYDQLPELAADLVLRNVNVIVASPTTAVLAAKAATKRIPIIFRSGGDPVEYGLVAGFNRPGGNLTGINDVTNDLGGKRLGLLHDVLPTASRFAMLVNPTAPVADSQVRELRAAAAVIERSMEVKTASNDREIDEAFASFSPRHIDALLIPPQRLFADRQVQLVTLAAYYHLPVMYADRGFVEAGGLMSYGIDLVDQYRLLGAYTGRVLKGESPSELPVVRPTKFDLVINLKTAKALGLTIPPNLLAVADEVIE